MIKLCVVSDIVVPESNRQIPDMPVDTERRSAVGRRALTSVGIFAVIALALGLRLYGLSWDEGYAYTPHPDERAILAKVAEISPPTLGEIGSLFNADESPWNPRWFPYGSFPLYLLKGVQLVYSLGPGEALTDLRLAGRVISALADVVTVAMVYLLGGHIYGRRVGLLASALVALSVIHIQLSHFFAVDTLLALITVVATYFMYRVAREGKLRDSVLAGVFIGLGLATKMSLAPIYAALLTAQLMYVFSLAGDADQTSRWFEDRWPRAVGGLAAAVGVSLVVVFIVQPYAFLDWSTFYSDVIEQSEMVRRLRDYPYTRQYIDTTPYWYHVRQLATWGLGLAPGHRRVGRSAIRLGPRDPCKCRAGVPGGRLGVTHRDTAVLDEHILYRRRVCGRRGGAPGYAAVFDPKAQGWTYCCCRGSRRTF